MKKSTQPRQEKSRSVINDNCTTTKLSRVFMAMVNGWKGHRFIAEHELNDHCLHTTVSSIESKYHVLINREWITVSGYQGAPTRVKVYWMATEDRERFSNGGACYEHR